MEEELGKERIKVRQPLNSILVDGKYEDLIGDMTDLAKEELNIKEVIFEQKLDKFMDFTLRPNFKEAGPILGSKIKALELPWLKPMLHRLLRL